MTVAEALRAASARLAQGGIPGAAGDARALLAHALTLAPDRLSLHLADPVPPEATDRLERAILARLARQPVSQIVGHRLFWGHRFLVTPDVLDPRPETETLVAAALEGSFARMLDLGTGSGAILLSVLAGQAGATGLGGDLSEAALSVARQNAASLGLSDRAEFRRSDWFSAIPERFDLILSNPPYIAADEMAGLSPDVRDWEPHLALSPGGDGLVAYRVIAAGLPGHLTPGGRALLEIGPTQAAAVARLLVETGLTDVRILPDLDGRDRVVSARAAW